MTSIILLAQHVEMFKLCLSRILLNTEGSYELIVVNDGASEAIASWISPFNDIKLVTSDDLVGVAKGYNLGSKVATGNRLVFIRDHMFVSQGWLPRLSACIDKHEDAAMAGPVSNDVSGKQRVLVTGDNILKMDNVAKAYGVTKAGCSRKVTRLVSSLLMIRREVFDELGGFDERYALESYEDDDMCYRALEKGYSLVVAEDCFVHYEAPPLLFPGNPAWYSDQMNINKAAAMEKWGFDLTEALTRWRVRPTISLCMIVKNEEDTLDRCLSSVRELVDEVIIVDTGSTDKTKHIAVKYADRIADFKWVNDFSKARNYAFSLATREYILWLDADDIVLPADAHKFTQMVSDLTSNTDAVSMHYNLAFDEAGKVTTSLRRNRLVKRERGFRWIGAVHEYLEVYGTIVHSDICITHDRIHNNSTRNVNIYEARLAAGESFSARDKFYFANELADNGLLERALEMYDLFLQCPDGWVEDQISACARSADCFMELGKLDEARSRVMQSFSYSLPRAEQCCRLGYYFMKEENYDEAIIWYKAALGVPKPAEPNAKLNHPCWTWLPHLQLCVCYDRLGEYDVACSHNEEAGLYIPNDSRIVANRRYFNQLISQHGGQYHERYKKLAL
jgi:GT2 family glycosyltransferase